MQPFCFFSFYLSRFNKEETASIFIETAFLLNSDPAGIRILGNSEASAPQRSADILKHNR